jgi:hypothetical protein
MSAGAVGQKCRALSNDGPENAVNKYDVAVTSRGAGQEL